MSFPVSLVALHSFVEVGRHGSIKRAAEELHVTPGAISQHIRQLEARFQVALVERDGRGIKLSPQGLRLYGRMAPGFEQIEAGVSLFDGRGSGGQGTTVVISTTPSFAACWLAQRLGRFTARHPRVEVKIETTAQLADLTRGQADVAIRHGSGQYPELDVQLLFTPSLVAIASPDLLPDGPLHGAADCLRYPLLQDRDRLDWPIWLERQGVSPTRAAMKGPSYADDALLIQAAAGGQGLAITRDVYAADALQAGRVVLAFRQALSTDTGYFIVTRPNARQTDRYVSAFSAWLLEEAEQARSLTAEIGTAFPG